jgi:hypothetical protein
MFTSKYIGFAAVSVTGTRNAWAVGYGDQLAARWQGRYWHTVSLPRLPDQTLSAVSSDSPTDAWAVCQDGSCALHWNGSHWVVDKTWPGPYPAYTGISGHTPYAAATVAAFISTNVWVFNYLGTWHLHAAASAGSRNDVHERYS